MADAALGERSTLFLTFAYRIESEDGLIDLDGFEERLKQAGSLNAADGRAPWELQWARRNLDDAALLPHLDVQTRRGELLRVFRLQGSAIAMFDERPWKLSSADGKKTLEATFSGPPMLFAFESGFLFIVVPVRPKEPRLDALMDLRSGLTRRGHLTLSGPEAGSKDHASERWQARCQEKGVPFTLREALAALVPGLPPEPPPAGRNNPKAVAVVFTDGPLDVHTVYRLRMAQDAKQDIQVSSDPVPPELPSDREQIHYAAYGLTSIIQPSGVAFLERFDDVVRDRYLYKWLIAEHQRLALLSLSSRCAALAARLAPRDFRSLRREVLHHVARYHFQHLSDEERHDRFYRWLSERMDLSGLLAEVKEEITELDEYLDARRGETLNKFLAFLTIVLTPAGLVIGVFQDKILPPLPRGELHDFAQLSEAGVGQLLGHAPAAILLGVTAVCLTLFVYVLRQLERPQRSTSARWRGLRRRS